MKYKGFTIDDNKIDTYVEKLEVSIAEACDLILEEEGKIEESAETTKEIEERTKNAPKRYERGGSSSKPKKRERKVDEVKKYFLDEVSALVEDLGAVVVSRKTETETTFTFKDETYTFKLTKHRPPKN